MMNYKLITTEVPDMLDQNRFYRIALRYDRNGYYEVSAYHMPETQPYYNKQFPAALGNWKEAKSAYSVQLKKILALIAM